MKYLLILLSFVYSHTAISQYGESPDNPVELGKVHWLRNYDEATKVAEQLDKPIFILFQEVPGCHTCTSYGQGVMSHPLIVEVIETYFVPLAIHNNKGGHDKVILKQFDEPTWNNPVARIVDHKGKDIIPRLDGAYSIAAVAKGISRALEKERITTPIYLDLLIEEHESTELKTEYLSMYCFWSGEGKLGGLDGVVDTEAGFMDGHEVVKVTYNSVVLPTNDLVVKAKLHKTVDRLYSTDRTSRELATENGINASTTSKFKLDKEPKYHLQRGGLSHVPMTSLQACRVNAAIYKGKDYTYLLSPRQLTIVANVDMARVNVVGKAMTEMWW